MKRAVRWLVLLPLCGCTFGDAEGNPLLLVEPESDAGVDAADEDPGPGPSQGDPVVTDDASVLQDADTSGPNDGGLAGDQCSPMITTCNPITKMGCLDFLGQQCVVDPESMQLAGRCVFHDTTPQDGGTCAEDFFRTTCEPGMGCFDGACQKLCTCDAQCESGSCCVGSVGAKAGDTLRYCGACP